MSSNLQPPSNQRMLAKSELNLIWLDMEMTGLLPSMDRILEVAVVVTDSSLAVIIEGPVLAIYQSDSRLNSMDQWNKITHSQSGLIERVRASSVTEADAAEKLLAFLSQYVLARKSPMCGNSICQDRQFITHWMPKLGQFFHYRNLDVSTLKELCCRWQPAIYRGLQKHSPHSALADIYESIYELRYYRQHFLRAPTADTIPRAG
ncbi:oligoribonuclease [Candidatus Vallotia cooleyia]|uniref:oligoribonuclease n=1 Tax=Candidatus Vallotiella adelgis TaxID=1177211 RepID=UPI001D019007|nr:oligoribonuclease [Candidatus Vallotia cooleyia]UDG82059.1 Oligoribonuclease [Candidatus Vallotia cooleyia]